MPGEVFDITCFTGINQYHTLRTEGECNASQLASVHIRSVDFEMMCAPDDSITEMTARKVAFEQETRRQFLRCLTYTASIDLAFAKEPNHERITPSSFARMQCVREDLTLMSSVQLDPGADIVTLVIDVVTDKKHLHLVKASGTDPASYRDQVAI